MKNMILIVGRTCSGKDTFAKCLDEIGFKGVKSYATRPKRFENEDTHIFISPEEADDFPMEKRVATTKIGEYEYFTTMEQFNHSDYYIIDPSGLWTLLSKGYGVKYKVVLLMCDYNTRQKRALSRVADDKMQTETNIFIKRCKSEDLQFSDFENWVLNNLGNNIPFIPFVYDTGNMTINDYRNKVIEVIERR